MPDPEPLDSLMDLVPAVRAVAAEHGWVLEHAALTGVGLVLTLHETEAGDA